MPDLEKLSKIPIIINRIKLFFTNPQTDKLFICLIVVSLILLFVSGFAKSGNKSDFLDYYNASKLYAEKKDIYQVREILELRGGIDLKDLLKAENLDKLIKLQNTVGTYIYPPLFAFLLIPLSYLHYSLAAGFFFFINFACLVASLWILRKRFNIDTGVLFLSLIFSIRFIENHANNNQVGFLLLFLILASLSAKNDFLSAALLSLATVIKLTPVAFIFIFLLSRKWKRILLFAVFVIIWTFLPSLWDHSLNLQYLSDWNQMVLKNFTGHPEFRAWKNNQSLVATLAKYFLPGADPLNQSIYGMPYIVLQSATVKLLNIAITLAIGFHFFYFLYSNRIYKAILDPETTKDYQNLIGIVFIFSVIFSGISWIHSFTFLLLPIALAVRFLLTNKGSMVVRFFLLLLLSMPLFMSRAIIGERLEGFFLIHSGLFFTSLGLYFFLTHHEKYDRK